MANTLQAELQRLAARPEMDAQGCANVYAGTTGLSIVGALNVKAGNVGSAYKELQGVLNQLALTTGLAETEAARRIA